MPNINILEGVRCPKCGQEDEFMVPCEGVGVVTDDGVEIIGHIDFTDGGIWLCTSCEATGPENMFCDDPDARAGVAA